MELSLQGKTALVCGGSKGIGLAAAQALAHLGAKVLIFSRNQKNIDQAMASLPGQGHQGYAVDLLDKTALQAALNHLPRPIQILICNSGGPKAGPLTEASAEEFEAAFKQHIVANQIIVRHLLEGMQASNYGRIVNIISTSVKAPIPNLGVSNTIRAAVASWGKTLANELGKHNITVNNVLPGFTATERLDALKESTAKRTGMSPEQVEELWKSSIPVGRFAEPKELGEVIAFLATPAASYINGINLPVDGGRLPSL